MANSPMTRQEKFVPLRSFFSDMPHVDGFPYSTKLSLEPLMDFLQRKGQSAEQPMKGLYQKLYLPVSALQAKIKDGQLPDSVEEESAIQTLLSLYFPLDQQEEGKAVAGRPFDSGFLFGSPAMKKLYDNEGLELFFTDMESKLTLQGAIIKAGSLILKKCYGKELDVIFPQVIRLRDRKTKLERYFRLNIIMDFVRIKNLKPLPELNNRHFSELLNNLSDQSLWLEYFPPGHFAFEGMFLGYLTDVTKAEVWENLREGMAGKSRKTGEEAVAFLEQQLRNYLQEPGLRVGAIPLWWHASNKEVMQSSLLNAAGGDMNVLPTEKEDSLYHRAFEGKKPLVVESLKEEARDEIGNLLLDLGYNSLILAPFNDESGETIGMLEMATPRANRLNALTLLELKDILALVSFSFNRMTRELKDTLQLAIQQRYTSIHQSVFWKFRKAAQHLLMYGEDADENIVFKNVYPLYGQADIVGSSTLRSEAIRADLRENLSMLEKVLEKCLEQSRFHLLGHYLLKVQALKARIEGEFYSSDENAVTDLLLYEIHPFLRYLADQDGSLGETVLYPYFEAMDAQLGILYRQRKDYEKSVEKLNILLGNFMEKEQARMQALLPHYFEIYKTDGVEYNIYLGQSILEEGKFLDYHLKDFRLWQLVSLCEATRLVEREAQHFPTPLATAQLIFVYNSPISIRFRMDDKRFDVDGAYNVRYEIIKKRIDKATVKGTNERLTQKGKVAIVYLHEKDHQEYLDYIGYLIGKGYVEPEIEELELNRLQGADGLKALRVKVV
ncbi:MAG: hypothetical protein H6558_14155 [Lewinellaceae bacterium]|nr:hypothetical protein [Lewinellaceae bacterium]MCB9287830.1 hypothetical protein [Lewinellaceae bacterium]